MFMNFRFLIQHLRLIYHIIGITFLDTSLIYILGTSLIVTKFYSSQLGASLSDITIIGRRKIVVSLQLHWTVNIYLQNRPTIQKKGMSLPINHSNLLNSTYIYGAMKSGCYLKDFQSSSRRLLNPSVQRSMNSHPQ